MEIKDIAGTFKLPILIRYFYSGCLLLGLIQLTEYRDNLNITLSALGPVLASLLVFFAGVLIWTLYHQVLGEFLIFPFIHWLHGKHSPDTCDMKLLRECGVAPIQLRSAYTVMRATFFEENVYEWIEILAVLLFVRLFSDTMPQPWVPLLLMAGVCAISSVLADIRQHSVERILMLHRGKDELIKWLVGAGFVEPKKTAG